MLFLVFMKMKIVLCDLMTPNPFYISPILHWAMSPNTSALSNCDSIIYFPALCAWTHLFAIVALFPD